MKSDAFGSEVNVKGWVRTKRASKNVAFIALNDGSCLNNCQIVVDFETFNNELISKKTDSLFLKETISYYQSAFDLFKNEGLKIKR